MPPQRGPGPTGSRNASCGGPKPRIAQRSAPPPRDAIDAVNDHRLSQQQAASDRAQADRIRGQADCLISETDLP
jgi:hypothetical protein